MGKSKVFSKSMWEITLKKYVDGFDMLSQISSFYF